MYIVYRIRPKTKIQKNRFVGPEFYQINTLMNITFFMRMDNAE
jgi:hypothetical protein